MRRVHRHDGVIDMVFVLISVSVNAGEGRRPGASCSAPRRSARDGHRVALIPAAFLLRPR